MSPTQNFDLNCHFSQIITLKKLRLIKSYSIQEEVILIESNISLKEADDFHFESR